MGRQTWAGRFSDYRRWAGSYGQRGLVIIGDGQAVVGRQLWAGGLVIIGDGQAVVGKGLH